MIVKRYNFETNSSSMHSLSFRRTEGDYTSDELSRSDSIVGDLLLDAIFTVKDEEVLSDIEKIKNDLWAYNNKISIWNSEVDFINSAMEVLSSFRDKLRYAIASAMGHGDREEKLNEIKVVFNSILPDVELQLDRCNVYARRHMLNGGVEKDILYPFLKENGISIKDFLTHKKYIVIVNYAEYQKMKYLNMIDENNIISVYPIIELEPKKMIIKNGIWYIRPGEISFGRSPFRVLGTVEGKARYALAANHSKNIDEVLKVMQEVYPELTDIRLPSDEYEDDGVDHGYAEDSVYPNDISLCEFILNKKYVVISDGDEYCIWSKFKKTPLFNRNEYPEKCIEDDESFDE